MYSSDDLADLRELLRQANVTDDHLKRGVRLTKSGNAKVAERFGISVDDVPGMIKQLSNDVALNEDTPCYTYEADYMGNITIRDTQSGRNKFIQGDSAFKLSDELAKNPDRQDEIISQYFDSEPLNEFVDPADPYGDEIVSERGTFNFPYKGMFATAVYGLDKNSQFRLNVESLRDAEDNETTITPYMLTDLNKIAMKWVDKV